MSEGSNVVRLPFAGTARPSMPDGPSKGPGMVAFLDIASLDEARLFRVVEANAVAAVIDARRIAVFARPRFRHRDVVLRLHANGIPYIEMMMLAVWPASDRVLGAFDVRKATLGISGALTRGLALCLHDEDAREHGWLEETRRLIRTAPGYVGEMHPMSLATG